MSKRPVIEKSGWLEKEGEKVRNWKRRWFVLQGPYLHYYKDPQDSSPAGTIDLQNARQILVVNDYVRKKKLEYMFHIKLPLRTYLIIAPDDAARQAWVQAIAAKLPGARRRAAEEKALEPAADQYSLSEEASDELARALGNALLEADSVARSSPPIVASIEPGQSSTSGAALSSGASKQSSSGAKQATSAASQPPPPPKSAARKADAERAANNRMLALAELQDDSDDSDEDNDDESPQSPTTSSGKATSSQRETLRPTPPSARKSVGAPARPSVAQSASEDDFAVTTGAETLRGSSDMVNDIVLALADLARESLATVGRSIKPIDAAVARLVAKAYQYLSSVGPKVPVFEALLSRCAEVDSTMAALAALSKSTAMATEDLPSLRKLLQDCCTAVTTSLRKFSREFATLEGFDQGRSAQNDDIPGGDGIDDDDDGSDDSSSEDDDESEDPKPKGDGRAGRAGGALPGNSSANGQDSRGKRPPPPPPSRKTG